MKHTATDVAEKREVVSKMSCCLYCGKKKNDWFECYHGYWFCSKDHAISYLFKRIEKLEAIVKK